MPPAQPIACQRSSSSTARSRYETTLGSSKIRAAVSNETPCFRRLMRFLFSSHAKIMCIYRSVAHFRLYYAHRSEVAPSGSGASVWCRQRQIVASPVATEPRTMRNDINSLYSRNI
jgi:hypothetical protein